MTNGGGIKLSWHDQTPAQNSISIFHRDSAGVSHFVESSFCHKAMAKAAPKPKSGATARLAKPRCGQGCGKRKVMDWA